MDDARRRVGYAVVLSSIAATAGVARAQTGPDLLLAPFAEGKNLILNGEAIWQPNSHTNNDDYGARLGVYNASGRMKLDLDSVAAEWHLNRAQPRAGFDFTLLEMDTKDPSLPDQFSDTSVGVGFGIAAGDKYKAGLSLAVGYAAANPFADGNGWYGKADLAVGYDIDKYQTLGVVLDYNGNRTFLPDVPLPGVIYTRHVDNDRYVIEVGFPYSDITWHPDDQWTLMLKYNIPDGGEANIEYKVAESFRIFGAFTQQNDAFHWDKLSNSHDRVLFSQSRAELGVRGTYNDQLSFVVAGGYAFNQRFKVGWDSQNTDEIAKIDSKPYLRVGFEISF